MSLETLDWYEGITVGTDCSGWISTFLRALDMGLLRFSNCQDFANYHLIEGDQESYFAVGWLCEVITLTWSFASRRGLSGELEAGTEELVFLAGELLILFDYRKRGKFHDGSINVSRWQCACYGTCVIMEGRDPWIGWVWCSDQVDNIAISKKFSILDSEKDLTNSTGTHYALLPVLKFWTIVQITIPCKQDID